MITIIAITLLALALVTSIYLGVDSSHKVKNLEDEIEYLRQRLYNKTAGEYIILTPPGVEENAPFSSFVPFGLTEEQHSELLDQIKPIAFAVLKAEKSLLDGYKELNELTTELTPAAKCFCFLQLYDIINIGQTGIMEHARFRHAILTEAFGEEWLENKLKATMEAIDESLPFNIGIKSKTINATGKTKEEILEEMSSAMRSMVEPVIERDTQDSVMAKNIEEALAYKTEESITPIRQEPREEETPPSTTNNEVDTGNSDDVSSTSIED